MSSSNVHITLPPHSKSPRHFQNSHTPIAIAVAHRKTVIASLALFPRVPFPLRQKLRLFPRSPAAEIPPLPLRVPVVNAGIRRVLGRRKAHYLELIHRSDFQSALELAARGTVLGIGVNPKDWPV